MNIFSFCSLPSCASIEKYYKHFWNLLYWIEFILRPVAYQNKFYIKCFIIDSINDKWFWEKIS